MMNNAERNLDESYKARKLKIKRELDEYKSIPDSNNITMRMMDCMVGIFAEGLSTGQEDIRGLLYCAYREARKLEPKQTKGAGE